GADGAEEATEICERRGHDGLDVRQGLARTLRLRVEDVTRGGGLDDHDADVVGEDVVKLARDPRLFLSGGPSRLGLAFPLEPRGPLLERPDVPAPHAGAVPGHPPPGEADHPPRRRTPPLPRM